MKKLITKLMKLFKVSSGFTLIELLVVIGILGVLAAALVATIDPFEQLKKADDAKIKNISVEFQTSLVRYYTTHGAFPWSDSNSITNTTNPACTDITTGGTASFDSLALGGTGIVSCVDGVGGASLISEGELKGSFTSNLSDLNKVFVSWSKDDATNTVVCFSPTSKSQKAAPDTKWTDKAGLLLDVDKCPKATALDGVCYWCTR